MESKHPFIDYRPERRSDEEMIQRSREFYEFFDTRRSVRDFSDEPVPREVVEKPH